MWQWFLRVSAYSQRLLDGLEKVDWSDSIKETQRNWIGRSEGAEMHFKVDGRPELASRFSLHVPIPYSVSHLWCLPLKASS